MWNMETFIPFIFISTFINPIIGLNNIAFYFILIFFRFQRHFEHSIILPVRIQSLSGAYKMCFETNSYLQCVFFKIGFIILVSLTLLSISTIRNFQSNEWQILSIKTENNGCSGQFFLWLGVIALRNSFESRQKKWFCSPWTWKSISSREISSAESKFLNSLQ